MTSSERKAILIGLAITAVVVMDIVVKLTGH